MKQIFFLLSGLLLLRLYQVCGDCLAPNTSVVSNATAIYGLFPLNETFFNISVAIESEFIASSSLAVYARASIPEAIIYYTTVPGLSPTNESSSLTYNAPYIHLTEGDTLTLIAYLITQDVYGFVHYSRSEQYTISYHVEASARPNGTGYLIPGVDSSGVFVGFQLEMNFSAIRAQKPLGQEFAEYYSPLGKGPYKSQLNLLGLQRIDPDLTGFEGGLFVNTSSGQNFGILIPHHNGNSFFGKVVRIDLDQMRSNVSLCSQSFLYYTFNTTTQLLEVGGSGSPTTACVTILDLGSVQSNAVGFRKGFVSYPYVYLSPGEYSTAVRLDIENFNLSSVSFVDLSALDPTLGGYAGGFLDGDFACFSPYRSYAGPVGIGGLSGVRSKYRNDRFQTTPLYASVLACVSSAAWTGGSATLALIDFAAIDPDLRGFSEAIKIGRYAYFSPYMDTTISSSGSKLLRLYLGDFQDVGTTLLAAINNGSLSDLLTVVDLATIYSPLRGFSSLFNAGKFLYLVPYRDSVRVANGQRGHGHVVRVDLNDFSTFGVEFIDMSTSKRAQLPSDPDIDLRGFSGGFSAGNYAIFSPFYDGKISGKVGRVRLTLPFNPLNTSFTSADVQVLDLTLATELPNVLKGFRAGFSPPVRPWASFAGGLGIVSIVDNPP